MARDGDRLMARVGQFAQTVGAIQNATTAVERIIGASRRCSLESCPQIARQLRDCSRTTFSVVPELSWLAREMRDSEWLKDNAGRSAIFPHLPHGATRSFTSERRSPRRGTALPTVSPASSGSISARSNPFALHPVAFLGLALGSTALETVGRTQLLAPSVPTIGWQRPPSTVAHGYIRNRLTGRRAR